MGIETQTTDHDIPSLSRGAALFRRAIKMLMRVTVGGTPDRNSSAGDQASVAEVGHSPRSIEVGYAPSAVPYKSLLPDRNHVLLIARYDPSTDTSRYIEMPLQGEEASSDHLTRRECTVYSNEMTKVLAKKPSDYEDVVGSIAVNSGVVMAGVLTFEDGGIGPDGTFDDNPMVVFGYESTDRIILASAIEPEAGDTWAEPTTRGEAPLSDLDREVIELARARRRNLS